MAIVKMSKLKLIGLSYEKEKILDALHKTRLVELRTPVEIEDTFLVTDEKKRDGIKTKIDVLDRTIEFLSDNIDKQKKNKDFPKELEDIDSNLIVSYDEFINASKNEGELYKVVNIIEQDKSTLSEIKTSAQKLNNLRIQLEPFTCIKDSFSSFKDTALTKCFLGTISENSIDVLKERFIEDELVSLEFYSAGTTAIVFCMAHISVSDDVFSVLTEHGFSKCTFNFDKSASEKIAEINSQLLSYEQKEKEISLRALDLAKNLKKLKVLRDYYSFELEKSEASEKFRCTEQTFTLEGFLPEEEQENVNSAILELTSAVFVEFSKPTEEDNPPTLLKNNKVVSQAEFVTNMYSAPAYNEFDPNGFVFIFFMLFFGVIMADIGYGILLMVFGFILQHRIKIKNGSKKLWSVIMYGGFFTMLCGFLFGSFFGFPLYSFLPDPTSGDKESVMIILLGCLALGVVQIAFGYILKAINEFRHKNYVDGIFDGLIWVVFNVGLLMSVAGFITDFFEIKKSVELNNFFNAVQMPGVIMVVGSLLIAALTAGRNVKGFGKFTKGFGAIYGVINLLSDILSYARLFGLMLSGMIIAQQFNQMGVSIMAGGGLTYIFGGLVMFVGHAFNLAMGVLGAYIHDCRLQYIEFFSKFYTGEGELFTPLGSQFNYIYLK